MGEGGGERERRRVTAHYNTHRLLAQAASRVKEAEHTFLTQTGGNLHLFLGSHHQNTHFSDETLRLTSVISRIKVTTKTLHFCIEIKREPIFISTNRSHHENTSFLLTQNERVPAPILQTVSKV